MTYGSNFKSKCGQRLCRPTGIKKSTIFCRNMFLCVCDFHKDALRWPFLFWLLLFVCSVYIIFIVSLTFSFISPDDRLRFLARIQWSTRILASSLSRIVVCWDASVAPAYCINVDFPIPVAYWLSVESVDYKNHVNISSFHFVCEKVKEL